MRRYLVRQAVQLVVVIFGSIFTILALFAQLMAIKGEHGIDRPPVLPPEVEIAEVQEGRSLEPTLDQIEERRLLLRSLDARGIRLDDEVRAIICPDKLNTSEWLDVMRTAHRVGLRSTATMMYDSPGQHE